jgi:SPP1 gp7 family putative phage head morphogenesis protein
MHNQLIKFETFEEIKGFFKKAKEYVRSIVELEALKVLLEKDFTVFLNEAKAMFLSTTLVEDAAFMLSQIASLNYLASNNKVFDTLTNFYHSINELSFKDTKNFFNLVSPEVKIEFNNFKAAEWANAQSAELISGLDSSTKNMVKATIESSLKADESWKELQKRIEKNHAFSPYRAEIIARTESARAYNIGGIRHWRESGVVNKVRVVDGEEFDEPCKIANGQIWTLDQAESNPLEHPNCVREFYPVIEDMDPELTSNPPEDEYGGI